MNTAKELEFLIQEARKRNPETEKVYVYQHA
jgi:hypothetical protein